MEGFAVVAGLVTLALSAFVCVRLVLVALRTGGVPEIAMGTYQGFVVGAIALYATLRDPELDPSTLFAWVVAANVLIALGVVALAIGVWRIYRPSERWAMALCGLLSLWVLAGCLATALGDALPTTVAATPANAFFVAGRSAVYLWGGFEGVRYYRMMRRRAALGLGDPVIAHQILLWGLFSFTMGVLAISSFSAGYALGDAFTQWVPGRFLTPAITLVASICLWLAFFPPAFYRRLIAASPTPTAG